MNFLAFLPNSHFWVYICSISLCFQRYCKIYKLLNGRGSTRQVYNGVTTLSSRFHVEPVTLRLPVVVSSLFTMVTRQLSKRNTRLKARTLTNHLSALKRCFFFLWIILRSIRGKCTCFLINSPGLKFTITFTSLRICHLSTFQS